MLPITIPAGELYDEVKEEYIYTKEQKLQLEHSLVSLSKWESKWKKPFLNSKEEKTQEESIDYVRCMTLTQNVDPYVYYCITPEIMQQVLDYIDDSMTATWFSDRENRRAPNGKAITAEIIYWWMIEYNIPVEFQKWHLNRLLTLIKVCSVNSQPQKKMSQKDIARQNKSLNAQRRKMRGTRG